MKQNLRLISLIMVVMLLGACASLGIKNKQQLMDYIDTAVLLTLDQEPASAEDISSIAQVVIDATNAAQTVTVSNLGTLVIDQLNIKNLTPIRKRLLEKLVNNLTGSLSQYFTDQKITEAKDQIVIVHDIAVMIQDDAATARVQKYAQAKMKARTN